MKVRSLMLFVGYYSFLSSMIACTSNLKLQVPENFSNKSTGMKVSGSKGVGFKKKIAFGDYSSRDLRQGWSFTGTSWNSGPIFSPERYFLRQLGILKKNYIVKEKSKYHFSLQRGSYFFRIFCLENRLTKTSKLSVPEIGNLNNTNRQLYHFAALILDSTAGSASWNMSLSYDREMTDGAFLSFLRQGIPEEQGYLTNGQDTIKIRQLRISKSVKNTHTEGRLPFKLVGGYEFRIHEGVVGIVDTLQQVIWIYNDLPDNIKMILASGASALLLRKDK